MFQSLRGKLFCPVRYETPCMSQIPYLILFLYTDATRMEIMELKNHPFYAAVQYHPEYLSRPMRPSPPYLGLILASIGKLEAFIAKGCQIRENKAENDSGSEDEDEALANLVKSTFTQGSIE